MPSDQRAKALRERVMELAAAVADPTKSDEVFAEYMKWIGQLHQRYSFANTSLILTAIPHATYVAGYRRWQALGRQVKYGQKGVPILVPLHGATQQRTDPLSDDPVIYRPVLGFGVGHVWDISSTEGPPPPNFKHDLSADVAPLLDAAVALAAERSIAVEFRPLMGSTNGLSQGGTIVVNDARTIGVQTQSILHELAHESLHPRECRDEASRSLHEGEAEGCSWAVIQAFGVMDTMLNSAAYIRSHRAEAREILGSLERITTAARDLIDGLERHLPPELRPVLPRGR